MSTPITMPKQGQSVETCVLLEWMKKKGEQVRPGDVLFTYETDKASFEFASPAAGVLLDTFFNAQDDVPVHTVVAVVGNPGESTEQFRPGQGARSAAVHGIAAPSSTPSSEKVPAMPAPAAGNIMRARGTASPRALRKAEKRRSDLSMVEGTGPGGRIIERDVLSLSRFPETAAAESADGPRDGDIVSEVRLSNMRKIIGTRMQHSLQQSAQLTMHAFADATALVACRRQLKARGTDITITDMVALAVARTLPKHPDLNSLYKDEKLLRYTHVHLAVAVDTPRGLMVPVVRFADRLPLEKLSAKLKELAAHCREGSINPDLLSGGTITISNLGAFGIESFTPILNPPQVAILGVNAIVPRPVQTENGGCAVRPHIGFSLTIDHRVVDGAPGARFLKSLCESIAAVDTMLPVLG
ncbi:MAG: 2-oxo acid dehydrogenase subunit E2 [Chitinispirillaceae bacterium]|nr:2-oxo acid dehydrogenase subunit E2 [Chitinispirillaceae bacterium]